MCATLEHVACERAGTIGLPYDDKEAKSLCSHQDTVLLHKATTIVNYHALAIITLNVCSGPLFFISSI